MSPVFEAAPKHIPAWKKLGLKLKYAKEDVEVSHEDRDSITESKKRKPSNGDNGLSIATAATDRPTKKLKKLDTREDNATLTSKGVSSGDQDRDKSPSAAAATVATTTPSTKRKSVAFTPETKSQDGEGVKQLYNTWLDKQVANDPTFNPSTVNPALRSVTPATAASDTSALSLKSSSTATSTLSLQPSPQRQKKDKGGKKAKPNQTSQPASPLADHPALTYLQTYHTAPKSWKFSKPLQNYLLKHLFSLTHIPPPYDAALKSYLRGLQGSARARVRKEALAIREDDEKWLASEPAEDQKMDQETTAQCLARQKREYDSAVARIKQALREKEDEREEKEWESSGDKEEWERRVHKRRRAEIVLWGVGEDEEVVEDAVALPRHAVFGNSRPASGGQPVTIQSRGMGGVRQISNGGIAEGSAAKKIVFGDDGVKQTGAANGVQIPNVVNGVNEINGVRNVEAKAGVNGVQTKRKRKRRRRTGVPDDDSSSESSSSSSSSEESEEEEKPAAKGQLQHQGNSKDDSSETETSTSSSDSDSDSNSNSGSGSSGDSDSD